MKAILVGEISFQPASIEANDFPRVAPTPNGGANILFAPDILLLFYKLAMCFGGGGGGSHFSVQL